MTVTDAARARLSRLRERAGKGCIGFLFEGAVGTCRSSSPVLRPVREPVSGAVMFKVGDVWLYALGEYGDVLREASFDYDAALFGGGLTVCWPHREGGCPNCR